ncbi:MAG: DUF4294 domain-containing protein [Bacteroidales bacterium]|nr:DUF4294 domain-containing protein [Bacteroidales bacterium]
MKFHLCILFLIIILYSSVQGQQKKNIDSIHVLKTVIIDGDTIPNVLIDEVVIFPRLVFKSRRQSRRYRKLVRDIKKAYPYAKYAKIKLDEMEAEFKKLQSEKKRKRYVKVIEKELMGEFGTELRKLTISQGRILLKLIDRETGDTSYELLKELRGGISAVFWQAIARLFGSNLKSKYDPLGNDYLIERIVKLIEIGDLKPDEKTIKRLNIDSLKTS